MPTSPNQIDLLERVLRGAAAGFLATIPMTIVMRALHRQLPADERDPLPPEQITAHMVRKVGVEADPHEPGWEWKTYAGHFGYGTACGALYAPLAARVPGSPATKGIIFGLLVWTLSYLGWLPAAGVLPPATHWPARRNLVMIVAHIVWGAVTGSLAERRRR